MPESGNRLAGYPSLLSMQTGTNREGEGEGGNKPLSANKGHTLLSSVMPPSNLPSFSPSPHHQQADLVVLLIEGSKFAFENCFFLQCIQCPFLDIQCLDDIGRTEDTF